MPWLEAVCGHHGFIAPFSELTDDIQLVLPASLHAWANADRQARTAFIAEVAALFLHPAGFILDDDSPLPAAPLDRYCSPRQRG